VGGRSQVVTQRVDSLTRAIAEIRRFIGGRGDTVDITPRGQLPLYVVVNPTNNKAADLPTASWIDALNEQEKILVQINQKLARLGSELSAILNTLTQH
jgi:hypothetical protein